MLDRLLGRAEPDVVVPANPEHRHTLEAADAVLDDPRIKRLLHQRDRDMRDSFAAGGRRLSGR